MSDNIMAYWTAFAVHSDPNTMGQAHWPKYNSTARLNMRIAIDLAVESTKDGQSGRGVLPGLQGVCDFFDREIGYGH